MSGQAWIVLIVIIGMGIYLVRHILRGFTNKSGGCCGDKDSPCDCQKKKRP